MWRNIDEVGGRGIIDVVCKEKWRGRGWKFNVQLLCDKFRSIYDIEICQIINDTFPPRIVQNIDGVEDLAWTINADIEMTNRFILSDKLVSSLDLDFYITNVTTGEVLDFIEKLDRSTYWWNLTIPTTDNRKLRVKLIKDGVVDPEFLREKGWRWHS